MSPSSIVELRNVAVGYDRHAVLSGLNLHITRGTFTGLLGTNGSGKTTLLKTIAGILPAVSGEIRFTPPATLLPHRHGTDGFFIARLVREG